MPRNVNRTEQEPDDRLTRICADLADALEQHPEHDQNIRAIMLLDDLAEGRGGLVMHGYGTDQEAIKRLLEHAQVIAQGEGIPIYVGEIRTRPV